jgi:hypothetical protein
VDWPTVLSVSRRDTSIVVCLNTDPVSLPPSLATAFQLLATLESPNTSKATIFYFLFSIFCKVVNNPLCDVGRLEIGRKEERRESKTDKWKY